MCGAASCGRSGSKPRQPWSCSRRASSPDEVTELQTREPNWRAARSRLSLPGPHPYDAATRQADGAMAGQGVVRQDE